MTSRLEFRIKGLEGRLAELNGEKDDRFEKLAADITKMRQDLTEILTWVRSQQPGGAA